MNKIKLAALAFAALFVSTVSAQTMDELNAKFAEAGKLVTEKKYVEAIPLLEEVIQMSDKIGTDADGILSQAQKFLPSFYVVKGGTAMQKKDYTNAIDAFQKAENYAEMYGNLQVKNQAGQYISQAYLAIGGEAYNAKDYAKAAEVFSKGYAVAPNNTKLALYLAESYDKLDSINKSIDVYKGIMALTHSRYAEDVAKAKSELTISMLARASKAATNNNLDDVVKYTNIVKEFDPANQIATLLPVQTATNLKKFKEVVELAPAAIEAQTTPAGKGDVYFMLASAYDNLGNKAKALESFKNVTAGKFVAEAKKQAEEIAKAQ